jgi:hypothetical protein
MPADTLMSIFIPRLEQRYPGRGLTTNPAADHKQFEPFATFPGVVPGLGELQLIDDIDGGRKRDAQLAHLRHFRPAADSGEEAALDRHAADAAPPRARVQRTMTAEYKVLCCMPRWPSPFSPMQSCSLFQVSSSRRRRFRCAQIAWPSAGTRDSCLRWCRE